MELSVEIREKLLREWLEREEADFDKQAGLLAKPFTSPGYHTKLAGGTVHQTRENMMYASALLDCGIPDYIERGKRIALKIAELQDKDAKSSTYGIWSWFYEEPLEQMMPPDWNWADFLGKEFLYIVMHYARFFQPEEYQMLRETVYHACRAIMKRDVKPDYTNISLMGTYVTYIAGEYLQWDDVLDYGRKRLEQVYRFNMAYGNFSEYNSPTYTMIAAEDLTRFYRDIRSEEGKKQVRDLLGIAWRTILCHFHRTTGQWAGPHGRSYSSFLSEETQAKLQFATGGRLSFMEEEKMLRTLPPEILRINLQCFEEFLGEYFTGYSQSICRDVYKRYGELCIGTSYQCPEFSLGSFYKNEMWVQRDNVIAYFGRKENPLMLKLQCLHDGYDFSSGRVCSVQDGGNAVTVVNFATDSGDTHPSLDPLNDASVMAEDMRIRVKVAGDLGQLREYGQRKEGQFYFKTEAVMGLIDVPFAAFGENRIGYEVNIDQSDILAYDIVLYKGERTKIDFRRLERAVCGLVIRMKKSGEFGEKIEYTVQEEELDVKLSSERVLRVKALIKPDATAVLQKHSKGSIDDMDMEDIGDDRTR